MPGPIAAMALSLVADKVTDAFTPDKGAGKRSKFLAERQANIFDRFAADFNTPQIGELFGAKAAVDSSEEVIDAKTGQTLLESSLAGKDINELFRGL